LHKQNAILYGAHQSQSTNRINYAQTTQMQLLYVVPLGTHTGTRIHVGAWFKL